MENRDYPRVVYHVDGKTKLVNSKEEFDALPKEWAGVPFPVPEPEVTDPIALLTKRIESIESEVSILKANKFKK